MFLLPAVVAAASLVAADAPPKFELKDGDRIVWIGNTLVEREQRYGYWETALHAAYPKTNFTLRNLGWSGDTVFGDARAGFDTPEKGFERLVSLTLELKPTVIFVSYGQNESFDGEAGLPRFEKGLNRLLDALRPANARVVLFTPVRFDAVKPFTPHHERLNADLARYCDVLRGTAAARGLPVFDLFGMSGKTFGQGNWNAVLTENGVHMAESGYLKTSLFFTPEKLSRTWQQVCDESDQPAVKTLRDAIVAKNELFFHRWRPQNETYLFGFRKHEQGKNATEVAEFDPLVKKAEDEIDRIKKTLTK
ncbi:MAG: SGNH/GDSL hydrolase family protein [Gemmataceae bacterium]|nr:SGNH/GDSL hydrolase family protein [Gemmataceae bacterium]